MVKQLVGDGVISLDYVRSEKNLADPLTKPLTRELVMETSRGMGLKPKLWVDSDDNLTYVIGDPMK